MSRTSAALSQLSSLKNSIFILNKKIVAQCRSNSTQNMSTNIISFNNLLSPVEAKNTQLCVPLHFSDQNKKKSTD